MKPTVKRPAKRGLEVTPNAMTVLERRYLWKNPDGTPRETPAELFERVADSIADPEGRERRKWAERFYEMMALLRFLPNSPTLMNAGRPEGQLSACFVLPIEDSLTGIFDTLKHAALIHQSGGGTGFSFSRLRPAGSVVGPNRGVASGPVSFMRIFDVSTETIKQGGTRRGANMAVLRVDHPDIFEFVDSKRDQRSVINFNISVGATEEFMSAALADREFSLRDPRTGEKTRSVRARELFDRIARSAWECGDPGLVFLDRINQFNPTPQAGEMESTNPCVTGETRVLVQGQGYVPIRELVGSLPRVSTEHGVEQEFRSVTQVVRTGVRQVFCLKTFEGYELRLTADHRVMTENGDVPAGELGAGDRVRLMNLADMRVRLDTESDDFRRGEVVGWLVGDGHFTRHEGDKRTVVLSFYGDDKQEAAPRILDTVRNWIGDGRLSLKRVENRDLAYVRSQRLLEALFEAGVDEGAKARLPETFWRGSDDLVSGFLRGLFSADGSVQGTVEKGFSIRLAGNELELLRDVQLLLLRLGIKSVLYKERRTAGRRFLPDAKGELREYDCAAQHELVIAKASLRTFSERVGFLIARKQDQLETVLASYRRGPYRESFFATVESVVAEGEEEVFDLSEPCTLHFHAAGILVHNCGEQPLLPYESCNLGSLNLAAYWTREQGFDWKLFRADIRAATRFLDNVVDVNTYPVPECDRITHRNRKIGLGVMGFADLLLLMDLPYDDERAVALGEQLMSFLAREARIYSAELAVKRGAFPNWKGSLWEKLGYPKLRNATVSTVAPTGTISIIAGASSGIEPIFSGVFYRNVLGGERLVEIHPAVARAFEGKGVSLEGLDDRRIGEVLGKAWRPASEIPVEGHVRMQAVFQRHSDSAVSKTINLPENATVEQVSAAYRLAYLNGCKGITIYRDRSRGAQVLEKPGAAPTPEDPEEEFPPGSTCSSC